MASRKTWIWIVVTIAVACVVCLMAAAGGLLYFASTHIQARQTSTTDAFQRFDTERAQFKDQRPLIELDDKERPHVTRSLADLPTSPTPPQDLWVLAWNPDDGRVVQVSLPFWLLKLGRRKVNVMNGNFDLDRMNIDPHELERIGPALVLDLRAANGQRVLVWTK